MIRRIVSKNALIRKCINSQCTNSYIRNFSSIHVPSQENKLTDFSNAPRITVTFVEGDLDDGERITCTIPIGQKLVDAALDNDIDIEAACGGELACSTCHCVFTDQSLYDALPQKKEEEEDMLDLAAGLTDTSRLSCQLDITEIYDGAVIVVPGEGL